MALIVNFYQKLFGPKTRFRTGDYVQSCKGGPLMIVQRIEVNRNLKTVTLNCKWFDNETKSVRTNIFSENDLTPFDWDNP